MVGDSWGCRHDWLSWQGEAGPSVDYAGVPALVETPRHGSGSWQSSTQGLHTLLFEECKEDGKDLKQRRDPSQRCTPHQLLLALPHTCHLPQTCFHTCHTADLFEERKEVGKDVERRKDAIYLYGVDVMSTRDVLHYFTAYGPSFVEWINDSSCELGVCEWEV